jgi:2-dehydropantoate 2-reductase
MRGSIRDIHQSALGHALIEQAMAECASVARSAGYPVPEAAMRQTESILLDSASPWAASMMRDIAAGAKRLESDAIIGDMLRRGQRLSIESTILACALVHLDVYQARANQAA